MDILKKIFKHDDEEPPQSGADALQEQMLKEEKRDMIRGIEDLGETTVKEVMVPRIDVDFMPLAATKQELLDKIRENEFSRFPVYSDSIDNVVGILHVKDLLPVLAEGGDPDISSIMRKPFFVPESKKIDSLLREFKRRHVHIAIAIDEYGGVSGIVCLEDIIEEIVGEIQDEFDNERDDITKIGENAWLCDARTDLDDLNEVLGCKIPTDDFDTLGGFVFDLFGKIPAKYELAVWNGMKFIVQTMEGHKIELVKIIAKNPQSEQNDNV